MTETLLETDASDNGGDDILPPKTTFSDESPDPYNLEITGSVELNEENLVINGMERSLSHYRYSNPEIAQAQDTFNPLRLGSVATGLAVFKDDMYFFMWPSNDAPNHPEVIRPFFYSDN
jgi:hypothetical protein